ncbi:MAG TPA: PqqD family protein [Candidatus Polarisedimenticolaceae bacterium]|nr:PqqD family protein [Candidatus Polarisedimenticolaceae bacterium]
MLPTRHEVKVLNEVGARIFDLLDGSRSQAQIARMIADEFDVSVDQANRDVAAFLDELRQAGMVSDEPEASGPGEVH